MSQTRFIALRRDRRQTIESYLSKKAGRNHWMVHDSSEQRLDPVWHPCQPKYDVDSLRTRPSGSTGTSTIVVSSSCRPAGVDAHRRGPVNVGDVPSVVHLRPHQPTRCRTASHANEGVARRCGPGAEPLIVDLDSTICETHGHNQQGAADGCTKRRIALAAIIVTQAARYSSGSRPAGHRKTNSTLHSTPSEPCTIGPTPSPSGQPPNTGRPNGGSRPTKRAPPAVVSWSTPIIVAMALPNFVIIGAAKCATTTVAADLDEHPDVFMSTPKEPDFFSNPHPTDGDRRAYESLFDDAGDQKAVGEASTSYTRAPSVGGVPERMAEAIPDARIIYLIRDPVDRVLSHHAHRVRHGMETRDLEDVLATSTGYVDISCYGLQLTRYLELFDREQILVCRSEDLDRDTGETLGEIRAHIGCDSDSPPGPVKGRLNVRPPGPDRRPLASPPLLRSIAKRIPRAWAMPVRRALGRTVPPHSLELSPRTRELLWDRFDDDLRLLRAIVGPQLDLWGRA